MGKSLIIGAMTNYNFEQVRPWVKSIEKSGFTGDKVMIVFNAALETVKQLVENKFSVIAFGQDDKTGNLIHTPYHNLTIHLERFLHIYSYLQDQERWKDYDYVITTDVKDVVFQSDPVAYLECMDLPLIAGSESIQYKHEPWGDQNLLDCYGQHFHMRFRDNEIYNVGTLGGKAEYIKDLALNIFLNGVNRPIPIVDQAVFNVLIQTQPYKDQVFFAKQRDGWALQAGTTVDPSKIEAFRPHLLEPEPIFTDGVAYTFDGRKFCILHQYDRVPAWKEVIEKKYRF